MFRSWASQGIRALTDPQGLEPMPGACQKAVGRAAPTNSQCFSVSVFREHLTAPLLWLLLWDSVQYFVLINLLIYWGPPSTHFERWAILMTWDGLPLFQACKFRA